MGLPIPVTDQHDARGTIDPAVAKHNTPVIAAAALSSQPTHGACTGHAQRILCQPDEALSATGRGFHDWIDHLPGVPHARDHAFDSGESLPELVHACIDATFKVVDARIDVAFEVVESAFEVVQPHLDGFEAVFDSFEALFDGVDPPFENIDPLCKAVFNSFDLRPYIPKVIRDDLLDRPVRQGPESSQDPNDSTDRNGPVAHGGSHPTRNRLHADHGVHTHDMPSKGGKEAEVIVGWDYPFPLRTSMMREAPSIPQRRSITPS